MIHCTTQLSQCDPQCHTLIPITSTLVTSSSYITSLLENVPLLTVLTVAINYSYMYVSTYYSCCYFSISTVVLCVPILVLNKLSHFMFKDMNKIL